MNVLDFEERPRKIGQNLATLFYRPMEERKLLQLPVTPKWGDIKQAALDGLHGKSYATPLDLWKMSVYKESELKAYEEFLDRHPKLKFADKATDFVACSIDIDCFDAEIVNLRSIA